jgi:hypothetical protein
MKSLLRQTIITGKPLLKIPKPFGHVRGQNNEVSAAADHYYRETPAQNPKIFG